MKDYFEGKYYKHQKGKNTIAFIVGKSNEGSFIQIITNTASYNVPFIGENTFSEKGICVDINRDDIKVKGEIKYENITPIKYDIMGPFKYFPMECSHLVESVHHKLSGQIEVNGEVLDFSGGTGYIEGDKGTSFPKTYSWVHCNDFTDKCSIMASIADIPFSGIRFTGCIAFVYYKNKEYRFATYLGCKVVAKTKNKVIIKQGKYRIEIYIKKTTGHPLNAPNSGNMVRTIHESAACSARFCFYERKKLIFDYKSDNVSFEYAE